MLKHPLTDESYDIMYPKTKKSRADDLEDVKYKIEHLENLSKEFIKRIVSHLENRKIDKLMLDRYKDSYLDILKYEMDEIEDIWKEMSNF